MYFDYTIPEKFKWFPEARYGLFIHWGPYSAIGRGEQVLFREHMDHREYEKLACSWNPEKYDPEKWAKVAKAAGMKYACLTTRHHDGYCLWDSAYTDYTSMKQAPRRDLLREFIDAFRAEGIRIGLYYSWCDFRIPAYYAGPEKDPRGWEIMRTYIHNQVLELMTNYGRIDYFFFDGVWPRCAEELQSAGLVGEMRRLQPGILINNRLGYSTDPNQLLQFGGGNDEGDFVTPEHLVNPAKRLWESCQVAYWRWWGFVRGERWKTSDQLLDLLCSCTSKGGNLILNVGPTAEGELPEEFCRRVLEVGAWLDKYGEAVYGTQGGDLTEALTYGYQTIKDCNLYLIIRFWNGQPEFRVADLVSKVKEVIWMSTGERLMFKQENEVLTLFGLPEKVNDRLFQVIKIRCYERPATNHWGSQRLWEGDPDRIAEWALQRGSDVNACK